jgi:nucleoside-diphosphate-sugar epimerase
MDAVKQESEAATIKGTADLLAAAELAGVQRFIHISSIGIYAVRKLSRGETISEESPLEKDRKFLSDYVSSKIGSEAAALEFATHGKMKVLVLRCGLLYGPRGKTTLPRTGYGFGKNLYVIIGAGRNRLPVSYVENCADAALLAAENNTVAGGIFNVVDDEPVTQSEFLRRFKKEANPKLRIIRAPYLPSYAFAFVGERIGKMLRLPFPFRTAHQFVCGWKVQYSNERAKTVLGWRPEVGKEEALSRTMNYFAGRHRKSHRADLKHLEQVRVIAPPMDICIIGCGVIAEEHLDILKRIPGIRVAGICDLNPEALAKIASKFNVPHTYNDVKKMLDAEKPSAPSTSLLRHNLTGRWPKLRCSRAAMFWWKNQWQLMPLTRARWLPWPQSSVKNSASITTICTIPSWCAHAA